MKYKCTVCGYLYDEDGIDPTTGEKMYPGRSYQRNGFVLNAALLK